MEKNKDMEFLNILQGKDMKATGPMEDKKDTAK
jgi:hypothetical protein